ncbi:YHS domain-containing protein [Flammeovirga sp. MY04]|uniref:YHS domain-containing (seleno)protein n=1 Tax=Flammeovirga sp. MY04 TaxID=1191459 RepID=UPI0008266F0B|nr:YHS domain-containing (seleno)protein [Flammeovirga sp. MY04]ANQ50068.2 YHS domain-containing protein [Flammeovirga sp. MY04]
MRKLTKFVLSLFTLLCLSTLGYSQIPSDLNLEKGDVAVGGYDPVSYFSGSPVEGDKHISVIHKGAHYYFASHKNKETFKENPEKYLPAYGGWCAYAMGAKGEKVSVNYETYKIQNGRLFLFYNKFFTNTLEDWNEEGAERLEKSADTHWQKHIM